jgi:C-terminal processing protease CtpA/Prc
MRVPYSLVQFTVVRPVLGISYLESKQARALGIQNGVLVLDVPEGSPAYGAGLRGTRRTEGGLIELGDIISKVEDIVINTEADLFRSLENLKPGDTVQVTVSRVAVSSESNAVTLETIELTIPLQSSTMFEKKLGMPSRVIPSPVPQNATPQAPLTEPSLSDPTGLPSPLQPKIE